MNNLNLNDMKTKFFLTAACFMIAIGAYAQKGVDSGTTFGIGEDSVRCRLNISLFVPHTKSKNFELAYPYWKAVYEECPASTINIYSQGVNIINWQISQETDPAKKEALVNDMMKLFDDRVKYFGNDPKNDKKDAIVARKAQVYNQLKGENSDHLLLYKWLGEVIDEFKNETDLLAVSRYMFSSFRLMRSETEKYKEQYVNDFLKCSDIFDAQLEAAGAANNTEEVENILKFKTEMEQNFFASGAADCDLLQEIYTSKVEENKTNLEFLKTTMLLLRKMRCNESDLFITLSEYAYKIEPTADAAMGLGLKAYKEKNIAAAEKYYTEAINLETKSDVKADLYFALASIALEQNQYQKVKQLSLRCLSENSNYGKAHLLVAHAYASGGRNIFPDDPVLSKCIYIAVVDKAERARQLDPSIAENANQLIRAYSPHFPTKEEVFMHPSLESGENFTIGGWVNETVKIR